MSDRKHTLWLGLAVALTVATGCVGADPAGASRSGASRSGASRSGLAEANSEVIPLERLEQRGWISAPAGCEDLLGVEVSFRVASARDSLVAAVGRSGEIICVDSIESVQIELEQDGRADEAEELVERFFTAVVDVPCSEDLWDDPSPQPSHDFDVEDPDVGDGMNEADPSPQPS